MVPDVEFILTIKVFGFNSYSFQLGLEKPSKLQPMLVVAAERWFVSG